MTKEETIIKEATIYARNTQDYIWGDFSILKEPFDSDKWRCVFQKRVDKISQIDPSNGKAIVELRKRLLQQAALSILAMRILDDSITNATTK